MIGKYFEGLFVGVPASRAVSGGRSRTTGIGWWICQPGPHLFRDTLHVAAAGGGFVHVVGGGEFAGEFGFLLGCEIGDAVALEQVDGVHGEYDVEIWMVDSEWKK